jgi:hypothetical protein
MDRDRDFHDRNSRRHDAPADVGGRRRSPNFDDPPQRWSSAGGHRASGRDWHDERDDANLAYGVGAEAAYGAPADERYFARRYRTPMPRSQDPQHQSDWDRQSHGHFPRPGYNARVSGQITQGGFWTPDLDGPARGPLTGDELRGHAFDHDYLSWREEQLGAHDRDYWAWREEQRQAYDDDYASWKRERQDKFGRDFNDWRSQRATAETPVKTAPADTERRSPLTASRMPDDDKKTSDV